MRVHRRQPGPHRRIQRTPLHVPRLRNLPHLRLRRRVERVVDQRQVFRRQALRVLFHGFHDLCYGFVALGDDVHCHFPPPIPIHVMMVPGGEIRSNFSTRGVSFQLQENTCQHNLYFIDEIISCILRVHSMQQVVPAILLWFLCVVCVLLWLCKIMKHHVFGIARACNFGFVKKERYVWILYPFSIQI